MVWNSSDSRSLRALCCYGDRLSVLPTETPRIRWPQASLLKGWIRLGSHVDISFPACED